MLFKNREVIINNGQTPELQQIRSDILDIYSAALDAVNPYNSVKTRFNDNNIIVEGETVNISDFENVYIVGFGKASVGMAQAVCDSVDVKEGAVVTNDESCCVDCDNIVTIVGSHPIPNVKSVEGADSILKVVEKCGENDILTVLISGGGSSLLCKPRVELEDVQKTTDLLLKCGADINEINTVRKHLSLVKGGQLVKNAKCRVVSFIISDIIGDPLEFIASGPTYPDSTTFYDAKNVLEKYDLWNEIPVSVKSVIDDGITGKIPETPKKGNQFFSKVSNLIVANNKIACEAAQEKAEELGYKTMLLTTQLNGEAREMGKYLVSKALHFHSYAKKIAFISGGETTVTIKGDGKGGRNQELVLSGVKDITDGDVVFSSFATDGIDGMSDAAGAIADSYSFKRAFEKGLDPYEFLERNDSYMFFKNLDDIFMTGPTGTNVMDLQVMIKSF